MSQVTTNMSLHVWGTGWVTLWRRDSISFSNLNLFQLYPSVSVGVGTPKTVVNTSRST